ncbi:FFLEELY motif protein [Aquabacterium sp.]|uniref:FFLEELY motif protein n=1 Tax=Aquabacterium sp. TaxID=1872578 RepID=UPI002C1406CF|nr:hypothetical protein [Aquabacterium sp.]HSW08239.1 hypothetical protein [Aquabacterium sp.]
MNTAGREILQHLTNVEQLRAERAADKMLGERVAAVKAYQALRFSRSYADLLQHPRYQGATRFFLEDLYGPQEFGARDAQFARVVPALVRMFPEDIVATVAALGALHALSESLDSDMARHAELPPIDASTYVRLWQATGRPEARQQQVNLTIRIGKALERYTRNPVLRGTLRMMRGPARAAGLGDLQRFLEHGFDTFGAMRGAAEFLDTIQAREEALARALFDSGAITLATALASGTSTAAASPLGQLP